MKATSNSKHTACTHTHTCLTVNNVGFLLRMHRKIVKNMTFVNKLVLNCAIATW